MGDRSATLQPVLDAAKEHGPMHDETINVIVDLDPMHAVFALAEAAGIINSLQRRLAVAETVTVCMYCKDVTSRHQVSHGLCSDCMDLHHSDDGPTDWDAIDPTGERRAKWEMEAEGGGE